MPFDFDADPLTLSGLFPATTAPVQIDVYGYCTLACFYCFANLNKRAAGRTLNLKTSVPALFRHLDRALADPTDPIGHFLREGYFAGLSNTTDPFQRDEKTHRATEAVLGWARANGVSLFIETKGNVLLEEWDRYAPLLVPGKTCVYVSLSTLDDGIRKKCEPGALPVAGRLELMRRLADLGCGVIAACNPYVPAWCPDLDAYCETVRDAGASDVFPFYLHLTPDQAAQVPAFYAEEIARANVLPQFQAAGFKRWLAAADRAGIHCALAPFWDAALGYPSGEFTAESALQGRGKQVYWLHDFMKEVARRSRFHGNAPVLFSWRTVAKFLRETGVVDAVLRLRAFDASWMHSSAEHKEFRGAVGKANSLYGLLRWAFNAPWITKRVIWNDPHTYALFDCDRDMYEADREGDLIGVYLPAVAVRPELAISRDRFDFAGCARMPD